jgi:hypothetical protein
MTVTKDEKSEFSIEFKNKKSGKAAGMAPILGTPLV